MTGSKSRFFSLVLALVLSAALVPAVILAGGDDATLSYARIVRLSMVRGDVQVARASTGKWEPAAMNMPLQQGFAVGTNEGLAEIEMEHGSVVWVAPNTVLQFTELALSDGGQITKVAMNDGTATFEANLGSQDVFSVSNQNFDITPQGKSEFRVDLTKNGVEVCVLKGKIELHSAQGTQNLAKDQTYFVGVRKPQETGLKTMPKTDDWDKLVNQRASYLQTVENRTSQYTTAPFSYGMADLSAYGSWTFVPGLGYAWQPSGMGSDWVPFSNGSMMYYDGLGWTWVSAEPWGWVPFHFGQWTYQTTYGWMWMPGNFNQWSPAPVQWVSSGNKIGWSPLTGTKSSLAEKTPTIVLAKSGLENFDSYKVLKSLKKGQTIETLASSPGATGKLGSVADVRMAVPTARTLSDLSASFAHESARLTTSPTANFHPLNAPRTMTPPRPMNAFNSVGMRETISSRPPSRMMMGGFSGVPEARAGIGGASSLSAASLATSRAASGAASSQASAGAGRSH
ncbi:MAG TPA: DUF6600 domain-containing protein [Candidatus Acidoferrum sp.]|nr:DUF6600 domain-containing protein [Candidatus Acidoferrum sp.]